MPFNGEIYIPYNGDNSTGALYVEIERLEIEIKRLTEIKKSVNLHRGKNNKNLIVPTDDRGRAVYWKARALGAEGTLKAQAGRLTRLEAAKTEATGALTVASGVFIVEYDRIQPDLLKEFNDRRDKFLKYAAE